MYCQQRLLLLIWDRSKLNYCMTSSIEGEWTTLETPGLCSTGFKLSQLFMYCMYKRSEKRRSEASHLKLWGEWMKDQIDFKLLNVSMFIVEKGKQPEQQVIWVVGTALKWSINSRGKRFLLNPSYFTLSEAHIHCVDLGWTEQCTNNMLVHVGPCWWPH